MEAVDIVEVFGAELEVVAGVASGSGLDEDVGIIMEESSEAIPSSWNFFE